MTAVINIQVTGITEAAQALQQIADRLQNAENGLLRATNNVADVWRKNFDSEGSMVSGGWPELADATQEIRANEGFSPDHPILFRYGALRGVAVEFFQKASHGGSTSQSDNYSQQVTTGSLSITDKVATLEAHGWKVANQWGHPGNGRYGPVPARPFWFVDKSTIAAAREGIRDWILDEVVK